MTFCICENKDADNCAADQRLCFLNTDSIIPLVSKSEISSPVCVGPGWKPRSPVFSQRGSFDPGALPACGGSPFNGLAMYNLFGSLFSLIYLEADEISYEYI